jgi:large subunit ribosomal protein L24
MTIDGDIELGEVNLPAIIAAASGVAPQAPTATTIWSAEPFEHGLLGRLAGQLKVTAAHVSLTPMLAAKQVRALARFDRSTAALDGVEGTFAGGRLQGDLSMAGGADGIITVHSRLAAADLDLTEIVRGSPPPLSGRVGFEISLDGSGRSPVAVIGSLNGAGKFKLQDGSILHLDPTAFDAVIRNVDQGLPIDATRIRDRMEQALAKGAAAIAEAEGEVTISAGEAQASKLVLKTQDADVTITGHLALAENLVDAKLTLSGPERADAPREVRPAVDLVLKGPLLTPMRSLDAREFVNWLALRSVEQQAKRLDALDSAHDNPQPESSQAATGITPDRDSLSHIPPIAAPRPIVRSPVATTPRVRPATQPTLPAQRPLDIRPPAALQPPG